VTSHRQALALHQAGKIVEAAAMYRTLLKARPKDGELLGLLGTAQFQLGNEQEALAAWRKSVVSQAPAPVKLRTIATILTATRQRGTALTAGFLAELIIPDWPPGAIPDLNDKHMIIALARALVTHKRPDAAAGLLVSVLPNLRGDTDFTKAAMAIIIDAGHGGKAIGFLRPLTGASSPVDGGLLIAHAAASDQAGLDEEARRLTRRAVEAVPVHLTAREPSQVLLVGILNQAPMAIRGGTTAAHLHFTKNTPANLALRHNGQYRFLSILPEAQSVARALSQMPRPQVILNNWVNGEHLSTPATLQFIAGFADRLALPVLNHPRNAAKTTRQINADRLAGIPDLVIPRLIRFSHEPETRELAMRLIGEKIGFPVIIRGPFAQKGVGAEKIDTPAALANHLATLPPMQLYAIEYVHNPVADGAYRKIRAAVIGEDVFITHVHFGPRWNVHRERGKEKLAAFDLDGKAASHAAQMIARPEEALGRPALAALHAIRARVPLDFYGIDFDLLPDGRVLFFEANAAMNLSLSDRPGLEQTRAAMRAAVRRLFENPPLSGAG
jgi:Flp pilus assembly protein TadD/glutathione synthase/RimK-type ligase-like ATP-grasp enzyme